MQSPIYLIMSLILMSFSLSGILLTVIHLASLKSKMDFNLNSVFECGFASWSEKQAPFSLQFFLTALIFLIFDVELLLMFPFFSNLSSLFWASGKLLFIFVALLFLGLLYEWNTQALEWKN